MGEREQQLERECQRLKIEVAALEALVGRYQDELYAVGHNRVDTRVTRVEEVLLQHERLYPSGWATRLGQLGDRPSMSRANGEACAFDQMVLPSDDWEWVSEWYIEVDAHTDEHGWRYAASWDELDSAEPSTSSERAPEHRVRRRLWKRERMLTRVSGLPAVLNRQLADEARAAATARVNAKLTQQLLLANERLAEHDARTQLYETQLQRLQDVVHRLSQSSARVVVPRSRSRSGNTSPRLSTSARHNADVLSQTEALLDQILSSPGLANLDLATTLDAQERRSIMVEACQQELLDAVNEFHDLVGKTVTTSEQHPRSGGDSDSETETETEASVR